MKRSWGMEPTAQRVKIVGHRRQPSGGLVAAAPLLELVVRLRGNKPFLPKGVHRFTTHEESNAWSMRMMARRLNPDLPRSPTSSHFAGT